MKVSDIMSEQVVTIDMDDDLATIKDIFAHVNFHHLLVVEDGELYGIISDRDYLKSIGPYLGTPSEDFRDLAALRRKAHQIMSRRPITIRPNASVLEAIKLFNKYSISCLPVVELTNKPIGIVTWRDVMRILESEELRELLR